MNIKERKMQKAITLKKIGYFNLEQIASDLNTTVNDLKIVGLRVNHGTQDFTVSFDYTERPTEKTPTNTESAAVGDEKQPTE
jgi:acetate kinase